MKWVICDIQALDYWFGTQRVTRSISLSPQNPALDDITVSAKIPTAELLRLGIETSPVHVLAPKRGMQRYSSKRVVHVWAPPYPDGSFVRVSPHLYVLSPIAALMRMSTTMTDIEVLLKLYQLVAKYRIGPDGIHERNPLMTLDMVKEYIRACRNINGAKRLRRVLPYVAEGAASPEEAKLTIMLVLPERMGGYGLPLPVLNKRLVIGSRDKTEVRYPDILWEEYKLILEYLGEEIHNRQDRFGPDAARKTHLQEAGYTVIDVTHYQTTRKVELDAIAVTIRNTMGLPPMKQSDAFIKKNNELREALFGKESR